MDSTPEILDLGSNNDIGSRGSEPSHLSATHPRSEASLRYDFKRVKRSDVFMDKAYLKEQKDIAVARACSAIDSVLGELPLEYGYDVYYKYVEALCRFRHLEQSTMATTLQLKLEKHFENHVYPCIKRNLMTSGDEGLKDSLNEFLQIYETWKTKLELLSKLFLYLDRGYLMQHPNKKMILEYGMTLFINRVIKGEEGDENMVDIIFQRHKEVLRKVREGDDANLLITAKRYSKTLLELCMDDKQKLYSNLPESIIATYVIVRQEWIRDASTYINNALKNISKEISFFKECGYDTQFLRTLWIKLKWTLIFHDFSSVISMCLPHLLKDLSSLQLKLVYEFCEKSVDEYLLESMAILVLEWGRYISKLVHEIIEANDSSKSVILSLVELHLTYRKMAKSKFGQNGKFEFELRNSFSKVLNEKKVNTLVVLELCKYCDSHLKYYSKRLGKDEKFTGSFEDFRRNVFTILKSLNNKNEFMIHYKQELSKRLLTNRSSNFELEKSLVDSFLELIGEGDEIIGLRLMFRDLELSKQKYTNVPCGDITNFSALVLELKHWPRAPKQDMTLKFPPVLSSALDYFTGLYYNAEERNKSRVLDWSHYSLHQITLKANFDLGQKELLVNLLQAVIFILFNDRDSFSFAELLELTNMSEKLLKKVLGSLSSERYNILIRESNTYTYNPNFSDKASKIRIPFARDRDLAIASLDSAAIDEIEKNRNAEFRSALVSIMKSQKVITYSKLLYECLEKVQKKAPCSVGDLKTHVEYLIENEYIKRDHDGNTLHYIP